MKALDQATIEQIKKLNWYQTIPLGENFATPGETGTAEHDKIKMMELPDSLASKSVLDIGCNEGFFAFDAERRGAAHVLAIDKGKEAQEKFNLVYNILESKIEFRPVYLLELNPKATGRFDIVYFLSVFHHLRYPFESIDRIYDLTGGFAFIEYVEAVPEKYEDQAVLVRKMSKKGKFHMLPTRVFMRDILTRAGFSRIELIGSHRDHDPGPERKMPGFSQRRVLLKAFR